METKRHVILMKDLVMTSSVPVLISVCVLWQMLKEALAEMMLFLDFIKAYLYLDRLPP